MDRVTATYRVEAPGDLRQAVESLAGEQSSGTFTAVPGETDELRDRFRARVERITELDASAVPALPGTRSADHYYRRAEVTISWNVENFGYNLPTLISTVQGNLYELSQFSGLKLIDLDLPESFVAKFAGPAFGIEGTRRLAGVNDRPLVGTIIKPSIGMSPDQTADIVRTLVEAGIDFIKDDELMANPPHSPLAERVAAVMRVINAHADRTGRKVMYAFNISDELDAMMRHYDTVVDAGGTAAMLSLNSVGITGAMAVCKRGKLAIHGHRNGWGMLNRHPLLGIDFRAYQKLWRLVGVDQIHVNGIANKFWESDESVVRSIQACHTPLYSSRTVLPVVSSGQWGGQAFETWRRTATVDLLYMAGGGILGHPAGAAGGVRAIQQAWKAAVDGMSLQAAGSAFPEFALSVEKFGTPRAAAV